MAKGMLKRAAKGLGKKALREATRPFASPTEKAFRALITVACLWASYWVIGWAPLIGAVLALAFGFSAAALLASIRGVVLSFGSFKAQSKGRVGTFGLAAVGLGLCVVVVDHLGYTLGSATSPVQGWSWEELTRKAAWLAIVGPILVSAIGYTHRSAGEAKIHGQLDTKIAAMLKVPEAAVAKVKVRPKKVDGRKKWIISPLPPGAAAHLSDLDARVASIDPDWEVDWSGTGPKGATFQEVTFETVERREALAASNGLVAGISPEPAPVGEPARLPAKYTGSVEDHAKLSRSVSKTFGPGYNVTEIRGDCAFVAPGPAPVQPSVRKVQLGTDRAWSDGPEVAEFVLETYGVHMIHWDATKDVATVANLLPATVELRQMLARSLNIEPWQLEISPAYADGQLSSLTVIRNDAKVAGDHEKKVAFWLDKARTVVGHPGWRVEVDNKSGQVRMIGGVLPVLPKIVPLDRMVCDYDPTKWAFIPHGLTPEGKESGSSLKAGPHTLVVGATGAGKSYTMLAHVVQALIRGHRWLMIDPTKNAVDFIPLKPWATVFYDDESIAGAGQVLEKVYAERVRRQQILRMHGVGHWAELPADVREREDIVPMTVVFDEAASLLETDKAIAGLDAVLKEEMETELAAKGLMKLRLKKLGREARNVGIFLVLGVQRPDVEFLPGEFRQNLGTKVQLQAPGMPLAVESLRMIFPGETAALAAEMFGLLDDGRPGLGVTAIDGGRVTGVRPAYVHNSEMPAILEARGVPKARPWGGGETVIDLGEFELDPEDLDDEAAPDELSEAAPEEFTGKDPEEPTETKQNQSVETEVRQPSTTFDDDLFDTPARRPMRAMEDDDDLFAGAVPSAKKARSALDFDDDPFA